MPNDERNPKVRSSNSPQLSEPGPWALVIRVSFVIWHSPFVIFGGAAIGFLSDFGLRISDFPSWHWHGIENLLNQRISRHRLRLSFVRQNEPVPKDVWANAFDIFG